MVERLTLAGQSRPYLRFDQIRRDQVGNLVYAIQDVLVTVLTEGHGKNR